MTILSPKGKVEQLLGSVDHQQILKAMARSAVESAIAGVQPVVEGKGGGRAGQALDDAAGRGQRLAGPLKKASRPGLAVAGAIAGVTAVSAAVSSARKRGGS
ncbi:hypothetical protein [Conexibacter woesei]|uniref:Uncharacterized protein n=1 Tax=Conexibacter woesei (strain DSM 14684 / CCUG 47730 / CIP 108061 / JCM 11494 / NBRC 100937 / ID131577) TaxID=469383 RepID=D3F153_CONWI|nr:hypothetical protein [Conexibacter woesei]ADB50129.1 hypothetical protein Cwoe_1702 [Conexibacter woesei DSM 14684]